MKDRLIPVTSIASGLEQSVANDIHCLPIQVVNVCLIGNPERPGDWVLVDTGMPKSADDIIDVAGGLFGKRYNPKAIILTHGHFDHVGAVEELADYWDVPVYAHTSEMPYLTGQKDYPEPDTTVEGGMVSKMSRMFPNEGIDLGERVQPLPQDGTIPHLSEWKWIHTPGHTEGHISLFRETDRILIAGDAFVTVKQEYLFKVLTQQQEISGPPRYLTPDWEAAWESVRKLEALKPNVAITGHGFPMAGEELTNNLAKLSSDFDRIAIPEHGRFVDGKKE
ncbi:MBL fold metallo-hydrolase [Halobacillus amylolyticus]|uniref:MBL fold metallo-hydrolase n=1 Tax=Halobacillus amylolyticus TaxID=2932259 RepID=A0ABY4H9S2_9BACI|nr:MBL fold metallo-hydrolase [Halobacillus amylolyticus]UOR11557.1 MBL fold metallo-hydrolase [Halobacillus amylolyticus]